MFMDKSGNMFMAALGCTDMIMDIRRRSNLLNLLSLPCQSVLDAMNARLAPFYLSHLLHEVSAIRSRVPSFGTAMFKFTLWVLSVVSGQSHIK